MLTIFYEVFSTFQNARRASRIAHHASWTLKDASLALQRDAELRRLALVGTLQQRQGTSERASTRPRAIFLLALFLNFIGVIIGDFA